MVQMTNMSETALKTLKKLLTLNQRVLGSSPSASTIFLYTYHAFSSVPPEGLGRNGLVL
jgi:hypothetical protein